MKQSARFFSSHIVLLLVTLTLLFVPVHVFAQSTTTSEPSLAELQQMASIIQSLQNIISSLKAKIETLTNGGIVQPAKAQDIKPELQGLPTIGSLVPSSGSGAPDSEVRFTATYTDPDGWAQLKYGFLLINTAINGSNAAYLYYNQNTNLIYLRDDANTAWLGGCTPGSATIIQNSYASLSCARTTVSGSGTTLTITWALTFKSPFAGAKNVYLYATDDTNLLTGWIQKGTWTINRAPVGFLDLINANGVAYGWSVDPDVPATSIQVAFYVDATYAGAVLANLASNVGYPGNHRFEFSIPAQWRDGKQHTLYAYGIDTAGGPNVLLASPKTFTLTTQTTYPLNISPSGIGSGIITGNPGGISCNIPCSKNYISGEVVTLNAVAYTGSVFAGWSGCDSTSGANCTVTMNAAKSVEALFGKAATINTAPVGYLDIVRTYDGFVAGWMYDPDESSRSIDVHVYIDGTFVLWKPANVFRQDVNTAYSITGNHGFDFFIPAQYRDGRSHTLNVYALDSSGSGPNPVIGSWTFTLDATNVYQASADFVTYAGRQSTTLSDPNRWYYADNNSFLTYYASHPECVGVGPCWRGFEPYLLVYANGQAPGATNWSVRRWIAPGPGSVRITGSAYDTGGVCGGDGVRVIINRKDVITNTTSLVWTRDIIDGDTNPKSFDIAANVNGGDNIDFIVQKLLLNNWCDWTALDPKIEFWSGTASAGDLTVKKTFLPGVSATPTLLLDGKAPVTQNTANATWNAITTGSHTLTVSGGVPKTFYAVCTNASECFEAPNEGATISFTHQYGQNDTIQAYFGDNSNELHDGVSPAGILSFLDLSTYTGYNGDINKSCSVKLYTNATGNEYTWLLDAAQSFSPTGIKINPVYDAVLGVLAPADTCEKVGSTDRINAFRIGNLNLVGCAYSSRNLGNIFEWNSINNFFTKTKWTFYPDVSVDTGLILSNYGPDNYANITHSVFSHELGHLLGLPHNSNPSSVMVTAGFSTLFPSAADIAAVQAIYPSCKPVPKQFSISLSPNPAVWQDTSPPVGECGPNGNLIVYNKKWSTRLTIQAPSSGDITITNKVLRLFDASGLRTTLTNTINWWFKKDSNNSYSFFIYPRTYLPVRAELTLSGKDDKGNPVTSTASVNLQQGNYYHVNANCTKKETGNSPWSVWEAFSSGSSCTPSTCE